MYTPKHYEVTDRSKMLEFMKGNSFGILFSHTGDEPMATHLPFMIDEQGGGQGLILGHMAKAAFFQSWHDACFICRTGDFAVDF